MHAAYVNPFQVSLAADLRETRTDNQAFVEIRPDVPALREAPQTPNSRHMKHVFIGSPACSCPYCCVRQPCILRAA